MCAFQSARFEFVFMIKPRIILTREPWHIGKHSFRWGLSIAYVCWYKPEFAVALTHDVFIIGLSLAPDDFFIRSLFVANLPDIGSYSGIEGRHIHIINPDPASESNYQFILSGGSATLHQECFNQKHIELMRRYRVAT